jgi:hypothetical protein
MIEILTKCPKTESMVQSWEEVEFGSSLYSNSSEEGGKKNSEERDFPFV